MNGVSDNLFENGLCLPSGSNLIELMKSRKIVEKALLNPITVNGKTQSLADYYLDINEVKKGWDEKPNLKGLTK